MKKRCKLLSDKGCIVLQQALRRIIEERLECEYDNLEELGTGAFGITYRATIKNEQKDIVIKTLKLDEVYQVIKSNTQEDSKQFNQIIKSFKQEAETLSNFPKHPNSCFKIGICILLVKH